LRTLSIDGGTLFIAGYEVNVPADIAAAQADLGAIQA
jgi:hypothetical protein